MTYWGLSINTTGAEAPIVFMAAFAACAVTSMAWTVGDKAYAMIWLATLAAAFVLGLGLRPRRVLLAYAALCAPSYALWLWWPALLNPNYVGCALVIALAVSLAYRLWWAAPLYALGILTTSSRGAIIAGGLTLGAYGARRYPFVALGLFALAVFLALFVKTWGQLDISIYQRLGVWQDTLNHLSVFGSGFGSFQYAYTAFPVKTNMTAIIAPHAYNDALELVFELGIGAIPFWYLIALCFEADRPERLVLFSGLVAGLTYFPLYIPIVAHIIFFVIGHLASERKSNGSLAFSCPSLSQG